MRAENNVLNWRCELFAMQMSGMKKPVGQVKVYNLLNRFKLPGLDRQKSPTPFPTQHGLEAVAYANARTHTHTNTHIHTNHVMYECVYTR